MAHRLPPGYPLRVLGSENSSPARLAGTSPTKASPASKSSPLRSDTKAGTPQRRPFLEELNVGTLQNVPQPAPDTKNTPILVRTTSRAAARLSAEVATPDSLADDLHNLHINSPGRHGEHAVNPPQAAPTQTQPPTPRPKTTPKKQTHFALPEPSPSNDAGETSASGADPVAHESFSELLAASDVQHAIARHDAQHFDWILSLPRDAGDLAKSKHLRRVCSAADVTERACQERKVYFGCNLLQRRTRSRSLVAGQTRPVNTYTLIATPLEGRADRAEQTAADGPNPEVEANMIDTLSTPGGAFAAGTEAGPDTVSPKVLSASPAAADCSPSVSRIEDTIEELDRLEDQFEAVNRLVRVDRVPSPDKDDHTKGPTKAGAGGGRKPGDKAAGAARARPSDLSRTASVRSARAAERPSLPAPSAAGAATSAAAGVAAKRLSVARPSSLLPPKPPAKSSKLPTVPTFELPGEAVARRLKEQREARMQAAAAAAAAATKPSGGAGNAGNAGHTSQRRPRLSKPPTIPTFELPGEAISRRKREEHEAKIRQQEEEERKRREFKARPIRLSITPSTVPRDTVASRARQSRVSIAGETAATGGGGRLSVPGAGGAANNKRLSTVCMDASRRSLAGQSQTSRGRGSTLGSSSAAGQTSRAASTSTGSISGKRSAVSVEDVQHQKQRGKEIFQRDSVLSSDRDRERREREAAAKQARQEAAERSRMLSREWAEKQKLKAKKAATPAAVATTAAAAAAPMAATAIET